jgi:branched-chain amino acid transport system ATP-binding protein
MLNIKGLCKNFGALQALNNVDVEVKQGSIHGIIGPNGSGKTTLFNCITGVLKPNSGTISFQDEDITGLRADIISNKGIHRTFQSGKLVPNLTVLENVMSGVQD